MQAAVPARVFQSHCAHDDEETMQAKMAQMGSDGLPLRKTQNAGSKQTVAQLKEALKARGLSTTGTKTVLLERLAAADAQLTDSAQPVIPEVAPEGAPAAATGSTKAKPAAALKKRASPTPIPAPSVAATLTAAATGLQRESKRRGYKAPAEGPDGEDEVDRAERLLAEQLGVPGADTFMIVAPAEVKPNDATEAADTDSSRPRNKKQQTTVTKDNAPNSASPVNPGTRGLPMASPEEAAREKAEAGENRAVEHVPF
mmetsp:Transcript_7209/g.19322  ORF Transcript_7209/g.19322 Transcript_7209/m.19322 type:complete len:257 (+) Transcript_7209:388-1158(+)